MTVLPVELITIRGEGLLLSRIVARKYRRYIPGYVERLYDINPGLAAQGPLLTVGTVIRFPAPLAEETRNAVPVVKLWD